ncbi:glycine--tRNA ligase subunit beta [Dehalobacter sp. DCM]|uniref:glycine--tRNA ligase subunit beta n=1 Tax=Dehalobacter sp. DCM TaxID=2907827 RepID=UPI0030819CD9|nr:glycine--tRNA ligase subunit beta [Dehalobacter sp. DCM]
MSKDFLLEIGMEEMPAKFAPGAVAQLENNARKLFTELRIGYKDLKCYVTPRRLALLINSLDEMQADISEEVKGPAQKAAYDADGKPTKAAEGFARGQGVGTDALYIKELNGVPYVYALKSQKGDVTEKLLPEVSLNLITGLNFPKPMRWGDQEIRFARPIRWLVALFGDEVVPVTYAGLQSGRTTRGHRTLGTFARLVCPGDYVDALETVYVLADHEKRKQNIWGQIQTLSAKVGGKVDQDDDLLTEISHLVEYPTALLGEVDVSYMVLPEEVITTPMKEHQRYFPVRGEDGRLLPYFITVRNGDSTSLDLVKEGNKKVLKARLEDAAFYFREDLKKPLHTNIDKLNRVTYQEKLGTVGKRVERLRQLAAAVASAMNLDPKQTELVDRAALLAKADLVSHMVYDFPELQGIMGAYYAAGNGEPKEVCAGILEHYRPRFAGDVLPVSYTGKVVSIADKLDAIVGSFGIGIQPTGSQDPYALRRQALGIVGLLIQDELDLSLRQLIEASYRIFVEQGIPLEPLADIEPALIDFFGQRIRYLMQESGLRYDIIDAVIAGGADIPYRTMKKAQALAKNREQNDFVPYLNAYTRCMNLSKKSTTDGWNSADLKENSEIELAALLKEKAPLVSDALRAAEFTQAYHIAAQAVPLIEKLFEDVMIMDDDVTVRNARLGLLKECVNTLGCLGDLSLLA